MPNKFLFSLIYFQDDKISTFNHLIKSPYTLKNVNVIIQKYTNKVRSLLVCQHLYAPSSSYLNHQWKSTKEQIENSIIIRKFVKSTHLYKVNCNYIRNIILVEGQW